MPALSHRFLIFQLFFLITFSSVSQTLTHGPIIGGVTDSSARAYVRTDIPTSFEIEIDTSNSFSTSQTFSTATQAARDNSTLAEMFGLKPNTKYHYRLKINGTVHGQPGTFTSFPKQGEPGNFPFMAGSCKTNNDFDNIFTAMLDYPCRLFFNTGDWLYHDSQNDVDNGYFYTTTYSLVAASYRERYSSDNMNEFLRTTAIDYVYDDHDYVENNASRTATTSIEFSLSQGFTAEDIPFPSLARANCIKGYTEFFPGYPMVDTSEGIFHKVTFGNIDFLVLDNRSARSPVGQALTEVGGNLVYAPPPGHTMLGPVQLDWFLKELNKSRATFKFFITGTNFNVGLQNAFNLFLNLPPDIGALPGAAMADGWAGFQEEQDSILSYIATEKISDVIAISGDSHTSAIDDGTNAGVPEMMAANLEQANSSLNIFLQTFLGVDLWNQGGQGIGNLNLEDAFGYVETYGQDSVCMTILDNDDDIIANYCHRSCSFESGLNINADSIKNVSCNGFNDGEIKLAGVAGTPPYLFAHEQDDFQQGFIFSGLPAGKHRFYIKDADSCIRSQVFDITQPDALQTTFQATTVTCFGDMDGALDLILTGGTQPYFYNWSTGDSLEDVSNINGGWYSVEVIDDNNCERLDSVFVHEPALLTSQIQATDVSCPGGFDGNLDLTATGGTPPYSYFWSNGSSAQDNPNMVPGNYSVTITDANGCMHTDSASVLEPAELDISLSSTPDTAGYGNGTATASTTGGTPPYSYEWSDGQTGNTAINLTSGIYSVTVTDANGCTTTSSFFIPETTGIQTHPGAEITVFPNPASDKIFIKVQLELAQEVSLLLSDVLGKAVSKQKINAPKSAQAELDVAHLSAGVYFLKISGDTFQTSFKINVVR